MLIILMSQFTSYENHQQKKKYTSTSRLDFQEGIWNVY